MGGSSKPPKPSAEERELQKQQTELLAKQTDILEQNARQQNLLAPIIFRESGVNPTIDPQTGEITAFEIDPRFEDISQRELSIKEAFLEREEAALAGELPVNPGLTRDLGDQEDILREKLRKQLGSGFEFSTPGQEALQKFQESKNILLDASRRGDLTLSEQLLNAGQLRSQARLEELLTGGSSASRDRLSTVAGLSAANQGLTSSLALSQRERFGQIGSGEGLGSLFGGAGQFVGGAASVGALFV